MPANPNPPAFHKTRIGAFTLIALHEGTFSRELPSGFIANATDEEARKGFHQSGDALGHQTISFTCFGLLCPTNGLTLIDAGYGHMGPPTAGKLLGNLHASGFAPQDVKNVLISHFHGDHIGGLLDDQGAPAFPQAELLVPQAEWEYWLDEARAAAAPEGRKGGFDLARKVMDAYEGRVRQFGWGESPITGVEALDLHGHTPGHTGFAIRSEGEELLFLGDSCNNPTVFARNPHWQSAFDMDGPQTVATRERIFAEVAAKSTRLAFFHAPFPAIGKLAPVGEAYAWCPEILTR